MSDKRKKAARERQGKTGERYSTARMHILGAGEGGPPRLAGNAEEGDHGRVERIVRALIPMVEESDRERERLARRFGVDRRLVPGTPETEAYLASPRPRHDAVESTLLALDDETRLKVLAVMYCGRDTNPRVKEVYYEILPGFVVGEWVVSQLVQKLHLAQHLRDGLALARGAGADLDEPWPFVPEARAKDPSGANRRWLNVYGGELAKDRIFAARLDPVARAARRGDREQVIVLTLQIRADYGDEGLRVARVAADAEGHQAGDGGYVLAAVHDAFEHVKKFQNPP